MERTRAQLRLRCDEEEDRKRRISGRKRKRVRYVEGEDVEKEEDQDEEDDEQPGPSVIQRHDTQENRLWTVTCGNKTGLLDVAKLERAEECIKCEGRWFSPPAFEEFGGKGSSKKWKATIFSENKSLQFWFEQGHLTTEGFRRRRTGNKKDETILLSDCMSESSLEVSETQSAEETEEDDVEDEEWHPGSEGLIPETEEESPGTANGRGVVDSGLDTSKEEEDKMDDEDEPDMDSSAFKEKEALIFMTPGKSALQKGVKVVLKKLSEEKSDCQSSYVEHPKLGDAGEREETGQCGEKKKDRKRREMGPGMQRRCIKDFEETENSNKEKLDMTRSEAKGQTFRNGNTSDAPSKTAPIQRRAKEARTETNYSGPAKKSQSELVENENSAATTSLHDALQLQEMSQQTKAPQTTQALDITQSSHSEQAPSSRPSRSCDLDTMDLDQLRREKIKMQIKVLKIQEEYYTQKIKDYKK